MNHPNIARSNEKEIYGPKINKKNQSIKYCVFLFGRD